MPVSNVIEFSEDFDRMTFEQGLAFITRMRRQLNRFDVATPGVNGKRMPAEYELEIRRLCDEVEEHIRQDREAI